MILGSSCIYVGNLAGGEPVVFISGIVDQSDYRWAMKALDDLIADGQEEVVFDYSGVKNISQAWFARQARIREHTSRGRVQIFLRDSNWKSASKHRPEDRIATRRYSESREFIGA